MCAVVMCLYTVWESHGAFYFRSRFLCSKRPIKKIRINSKIPCSQSPSFLVPRPCRQREAKRTLGTRMKKACNQIVCFPFYRQNLADIVAKQQKLKYYTQLKSGRYTPLCKTPETLEAELQKQRARLQSLMTIVDRLNQEFPQAQPALRKITLSLGYRGIPEEATT